MGFFDALGSLVKDAASAAIPALIARGARKLEGAPRTGFREAQILAARAAGAAVPFREFGAAPTLAAPVGVPGSRSAPLLAAGGPMATSFPGGAPVRRAGIIGDVLSGRGLLGLGESVIDGPVMVDSCGRPRARAFSMDVGGRMQRFVPVPANASGRPMAFSGDLAACRRLKKTAAKLNSAVGRRGRR